MGVFIDYKITNCKRKSSLINLNIQCLIVLLKTCFSLVNGYTFLSIKIADSYFHQLRADFVPSDSCPHVNRSKVGFHGYSFRLMWAVAGWLSKNCQQWKYSFCPLIVNVLCEPIRLPTYSEYWFVIARLLYIVSFILWGFCLR